MAKLQQPYLGRPPGIPSPGFSMSLRGTKGSKIIPPLGGPKGSKSDLPMPGKCAGGSSLKRIFLF